MAASNPPPQPPRAFEPPRASRARAFSMLAVAMGGVVWTLVALAYGAPRGTLLGGLMIVSLALVAAALHFLRAKAADAEEPQPEPPAAAGAARRRPPAKTFAVLSRAQTDSWSETKFCTECGARVEMHFKFCPSCGHGLQGQKKAPGP